MTILYKLGCRATVLFSCLILLAGVCGSAAAKIELVSHPKLQVVAAELIAENYYSQAELDALFAAVNIQPSVLEAMQNPAEYKFTWGKYRKLFLQDDRIQRGVEFWQQFESQLSRAEQQFGVPASVIVAIIGVESKFGEYKGKHKVLDSLSTLVVGFERRSNFFASELKQFLILTKENSLAAAEIMGSYAGAVGFPQFISSSYRHYAVDFSGDGKVDLINQPIDAIGSVANYLNKNGWLAGQPVSSPPYLEVAPAVTELANRKREVLHTAQALRALGAPLAADITDTEKLNVLMLDASEVVIEPEVANVYLVRSGDTACEIAEQQDVTCKSLISMNKLDERATIFRGQRLQLPPRRVNPGPVAAAGKSRSDSDATPLPETVEHKAEGANISPGSVGEDAVMERYFFTHENFYVITRYNQSVLYAMAVHDLSNAIATARDALGVTQHRAQ